MWVSNVWNNFAPFAGYMLRGYVKRGRVENGGQEIDEAGERADETPDTRHPHPTRGRRCNVSH